MLLMGEYFIILIQKISLAGVIDMKIINLFTIYFLILLVIQGTILSTVDSNSLKKAGMTEASRKAKIIGEIIIILGCVLFILRLVL